MVCSLFLEVFCGRRVDYAGHQKIRVGNQVDARRQGDLASGELGARSAPSTDTVNCSGIDSASRRDCPRMSNAQVVGEANASFGNLIDQHHPPK
jgi:hypothetical protein